MSCMFKMPVSCEVFVSIETLNFFWNIDAGPLISLKDKKFYFQTFILLHLKKPFSKILKDNVACFEVGLQHFPNLDNMPEICV